MHRQELGAADLLLPFPERSGMRRPAGSSPRWPCYAAPMLLNLTGLFLAFVILAIVLGHMVFWIGAGLFGVLASGALAISVLSPR